MIGTTYSYREIEYRGGSHVDALAALLSLRPALIRVGTYWSDIQPTRGEWRFDRVLDMLDRCQAAGQPVMLTVGRKAPRWPEFYDPDWVTDLASAEARQTALHAYLARLVTACAPYACVTYWQVENEPLDPSGPGHLTVDLSHLEGRVRLVRGLDTRPIHLNVWGNTLSRRGHLGTLLHLADTVGLDLYYREPGWLGFRGPRDRDADLRDIITAAAKPVWITELQAEPWEYLDRWKWRPHPWSVKPADLHRSYQRAASLGADTILLWGAEYWWWQRQRGNTAWWDAAAALFAAAEQPF